MPISNFRHTGLNQASVAHVEDDGQVVAAPGAGKQIIIHDIFVEGATNILDADGGNKILPFSGGANMNFKAGVPMGENKAVWSDGNNKTVIITYSVMDV